MLRVILSAFSPWILEIPCWLLDILPVSGIDIIWSL